MTSRVEPQTIADWLEWASPRLIAMPTRSHLPAPVRALWPDYSLDRHQVLEFRGATKLRAMAPSADEILIMDEIILLPGLCSDQKSRHIIHMRTQIHPIRETRINTWLTIANKFQIKIYTAKHLYDNGLVDISRKIPGETVCRIEGFLAATR